ncbi:MAG: hypothetical protein ACTHMC_21850 [Pseudobacter sp.]|uniref:hypothetical protein n=1 Tax=Pseudobacter sp. TaxID=2045420 RepID=UPI003F7DD79E
MKLLFLLLFSTILLSETYSQTPDKFSSVDFGYIDSTWTYRNDGLGIIFPLQKDWYLLNAIAKPGIYVKAGSAQSNIDGYNKPVQLPAAQFEKFHTSSIATLFAVSILNANAETVKQPLDYNADKTFFFGLTKATYPDAYDFLRITCRKCTDEMFSDMFYGKLKLGNTEFAGYITGVTDLQGNKMGHFFGVKKIKDLYLVLRFNFPDMEAFEKYQANFSGLSVK